MDRFPTDWSDEHLNRAIVTYAEPLTDLSALPVEVARDLLIQAFCQLTVPTEQVRNALRRLLSRARCGAVELYPDAKAFLTRAYARTRSPCSLPMICITGLAGTGKSWLVRALMRALPVSTTVEVPGHSQFRLVAGHQLTASAGIGLRQILEPIFPGGAPAGAAIGRAAHHQLALDGVSILVPDELQFVAHSKTSTQVTNLLLHFGTLGPPVAFVTNFSLLHRLARRPQEQRDRLLADPLILLPDAVDSDDWKVLLQGWLAIHPTFTPLWEVPDLLQEMHRLTFGLKRNVPKLLTLAYCFSRESRASHTRMVDVRRAYLSLAYASSRADVEVLLKSHITGLATREDLYSPIKGASFSEPVRDAPRPCTTHAEELGQAALISTLTARESAHLKGVIAATGCDQKPERAVRPKATAASLAAGARAHGNVVAKR